MYRPYAFEIKKDFYEGAKKWIESELQIKKDIEEFGFAKAELEKTWPTLWSEK